MSRSITLVAGLVFALPSFVLAALIPNGGEVRVNTTTTGIQSHVEYAISANGSAVAVWDSDDASHDGSGRAVVGQRYSPLGVAGSEFVINSTSTGNQQDAAVSIADNGMFVVVWEGPDANGDGVYAQVYNADGTRLGGELAVNTSTLSFQDEAHVAMQGDGSSFVVVFTNNDTTRRISARRYTISGGIITPGTELTVNGFFAIAEHSSPRVAMDSSGNFNVCWVNPGDTIEPGRAVFLKRFNSSGVSLGSDFLVNTTTAGDQQHPDISMTDTRTIIVWETPTPGNGVDVVARRFDAAGQTLSGELAVASFPAGDQLNPSVSCIDTDQYAVAWENRADNSIRVRLLDALGAGSEQELIVNTTAGSQRNPDVFLFSTTAAVVMWDGAVTGDARGIGGRSYGIFDGPPTISDIGNQMIPEDGSTGAIPFTVGDTVTAPGSLMVTFESNNPSLIPKSNISLGGADANRTITATPVSNGFGTATITVTVSDGPSMVSDSFVVTVTSVNDVPSISTVQNQTVDEDMSTGPLSFMVGDIETSSELLMVTAVSDNQTLIPNANVIVGGAGTNRTVNVTPAANQFGSAQITLTVTDGDLESVISQFLVTVDPLNDLPVADSADVNTDEDVALPIALVANDADNDTLTYRIVSGPTSGSLTGSGASRTYTPSANFNGVDSFVFVANDGTGDSDEATISITINAVDDPPEAGPDYAFLGLKQATVDVLANDGDIDSPGAPVVITGFVQPTIGTVTQVGNNLVYTADPANPLLTPVTFTYTIEVSGLPTDGTVTVYPAPSRGSKMIGLVFAEGDNLHVRGIVNITYASNSVGTAFLTVDDARWGFSGSVSGSPATLTANANGYPTIRLSFTAGPPVGENPTLLMNTTYNGTPYSARMESAVTSDEFTGRYTALVFDSSEGQSEIPRNAGYLTFTVSGNGSVTFSGKSGNNQVINFSTLMTTGSRVPFHAFMPDSTLGGFITLSLGAPSVAGVLQWTVRSEVEPRLPEGLDAEYRVFGNRYIPGTRARDLFRLPPNAPVALEVIIPSAEVEATFDRNVPATGTYIYGDAPITAITATPSNGFFAGQYYLGTVRRNFIGVVIQGFDIGEGLLLDTNEISNVFFFPDGGEGGEGDGGER